MRRVAVCVLLCLVCTAGSGPALSKSALVAVEQRYRDELTLDVYRPASPRAVVVLLPGCCGDRRDLGTLARALARRGAVVLNPDMHVRVDGRGWPDVYSEAVCAVSAGRRIADADQGLARHLTVVGWSDGALVGASIVLGWGTLARQLGGDCVDRPGRGPDRFIGLAGHYGWPANQPANDIVTPAAAAWFGGYPDQVPAAWQQGNPGQWVPLSDPDVVPPILLIAGDRKSVV